MAPRLCLTRSREMIHHMAAALPPPAYGACCPPRITVADAVEVTVAIESSLMVSVPLDLMTDVVVVVGGMVIELR